MRISGAVFIAGKRNEKRPARNWETIHEGRVARLAAPQETIGIVPVIDEGRATLPRGETAHQCEDRRRNNATDPLMRGSG
jgi:hypothetical protein